MILVGVHGKMGAGKDTLCQYMIEELDRRGKRAVRRAFADTLKVSAARSLGFEGTDEQLVGWMNTLKVDGEIHVSLGSRKSGALPTTFRISGREYLQWYGTEGHRQVFGDAFWVEALLPGDPRASNPLEFANLAAKRGSNFDNADVGIITDVRFENEADAVARHGGRVVQILRPGQGAGGGQAHTSEVSLPAHLIDYIVDNDSNLTHLQSEAVELVEWLGQA